MKSLKKWIREDGPYALLAFAVLSVCLTAGMYSLAGVACGPAAHPGPLLTTSASAEFQQSKSITPSIARYNYASRAAIDTTSQPTPGTVQAGL